MKSTFDPQKHHRRSIRLKGYDYASAGAYFVTIVTYQRECVFGEIVNGEMRLNEVGKIVEKTWNDLPNHYSNVELGAFCIMPNHVHGIIILIDTTVGAGHVVGAGLRPAPTPTTKHHGLPEIVRAFKSFSARHVNEHLHSPGISLWQRNYYEHIIRDNNEHNRIHLYIESNPANWMNDEENGFRNTLST
jgi:REP element-mobilizing transposase RayT